LLSFSVNTQFSLPSRPADTPTAITLYILILNVCVYVYAFENNRIRIIAFNLYVFNSVTLFIHTQSCWVEPGSSVSIVSDYGLGDRAIGVRSSAVAKDFFLQPLCPDRLWGSPSFLYNGYRGSFPRGKSRPGCDADHSPHLVPRSWMSRSYTSSPPKRHHSV
jgi:hypothetical protein